MEARDEAKKQKTQKNESQIKHTRIRQGSHISVGNEVLYVDPLNKDINGDENNVCL